MAAPTQDLPPKGGYEAINFKRIPARTLFSGRQIFAGFSLMTAVAGYLYFRTYKKIRIEEVEMRSATLALEPLLLAERDREFLKQLRRNRDEEEKLMAGVEGWEVGKHYGEPIYKTVPSDRFIDPIVQEYYAHGPTRSFTRHSLFSLWS
ncbi:NADH dehydrogenase [ubiquinone] 1 alpha subcomplex subunit 13-like [Penaeus monodon]|uniref:NADH dehydrogenase [ubiquinone] 1 alpha subcomplex subunit 13-like n=1 Tax=Penaeus monodon TaxID=6687 RepID=UPI0018A7CA44|nr:NADH dehydrogenase [ubiquinone] 1 alpha subcomplex subunit 13-like [Penaeus monodon]